MNYTDTKTRNARLKAMAGERYTRADPDRRQYIVRYKEKRDGWENGISTRPLVKENILKSLSGYLEANKINKVSIKTMANLVSVSVDHIMVLMDELEEEGEIEIIKNGRRKFYTINV